MDGFSNSDNTGNNTNQPASQPAYPPPPQFPAQNTPPAQVFRAQETLATDQTDNGSNGPSRKKTALKILLVCIIAFVFLSTASVVMFAYNVIPVGDQKIKNQIADVIMKVPFMPKTPRYVLFASADAHSGLTRANVDISLAADINDQSLSLYGLNNFDVQIKGPVDFTDYENPLASLNISLNKDFNLDMRIKDDKAYFKINALPLFLTLLLANFGFPEDFKDQISNKWLYTDISTLQTDARKSLDEQAESLLAKEMKKLYKAYDDKDVIKILTMKSEEYNGFDVYRVSFKPTDDVLSKFWEIYTERKTTGDNVLPIKDFVFESWVDKKTYLAHKTSIVFKIKQSPLNSFSDLGLPLAQNEIPVAIVVSLSDFGKEISVETPEGAMDLETFIEEMFINQQDYFLQ